MAYPTGGGISLPRVQPAAVPKRAGGAVSRPPTIGAAIANTAKGYTPAPVASGSATPAVAPLAYKNQASGSQWSPFTPPGAAPSGGARAQLAAEQAAGMYEADPILAQVKQNMMGQVATHVGDTNRTIKDSLRGFGDPNLARQATFFTADPNVTTTGDEETAQAAAANPTSVLAQLAQGHQQRLGTLDNNLNAANLWFSSTRGNELANENQTYLGDQATAQSQLGSSLSQAVRDLLGFRDQSYGALAGANQDAYSRALQLALANGVDPTQKTIPGLVPGTVGDNTAFGGNPSSGYLSPGSGGGENILGDANRPAYAGPDGSQVSPLTNRSLGYTPEAIPDGLVEPPMMPQALLDLLKGVPEDPFSTTYTKPQPTAHQIVRPTPPPPGALNQAIAAGIKSRRY